MPENLFQTCGDTTFQKPTSGSSQRSLHGGFPAPSASPCGSRGLWCLRLVPFCPFSVLGSCPLCFVVVGSEDGGEAEPRATLCDSAFPSVCRQPFSASICPNGPDVRADPVVFSVLGSPQVPRTPFSTLPWVFTVSQDLLRGCPQSRGFPFRIPSAGRNRDMNVLGLSLHLELPPHRCRRGGHFLGTPCDPAMFFSLWLKHFEGKRKALLLPGVLSNVSSELFLRPGADSKLVGQAGWEAGRRRPWEKLL